MSPEVESFKAKMFRNEIETDIMTGKVIKQKELGVSGQNLDEVKKVFDEEWEKSVKVQRK